MTAAALCPDPPESVVAIEAGDLPRSTGATISGMMYPEPVLCEIQLVVAQHRRVPQRNLRRIADRGTR